MPSVQDDQPAIVGVIFSGADLKRAVALKRPPDLFELRLDALAQDIRQLRKDIGKLRAPLIITVRHPLEGGVNQLSSKTRQALFLAFLPYAAYVDIELRSARTLAAVLRAAKGRGVGVIASFHEFKEIPSATRLDEVEVAMRSLEADVLKFVAPTDDVIQLATLRDFFLRHRRRRISVMGVGRLARKSRVDFASLGSVFNYAHLGQPRVEGQLSVTELRRILAKNKVTVSVPVCRTPVR